MDPMPQAAPKPCTQCKVLVFDGSSRCMAHKVQAWAKRPDVVKRQSGRALQRKRAELFAREPLCRECAKRGLVTLAVIRDHIVPLAEGGLDVDSNCQPLCQPCSDAKTATESARGAGRPHPGRRRGDQPSITGGGGQKSGAPRPETDLEGKFLRAGNPGGGVPPAGQGGGA